MRVIPDSWAARRMRSAWASVAAMGLSWYTCTPRRAAASATSALLALSVQTRTASSSSWSSMVVQDS